jgi:SAM-dependent methyltransferase
MVGLSADKKLEEPSAKYGGIPVFLRFSNVDEELSAHPEEVRAIDLAKSIGWKSALQSVFGPEMVAYATNPARSRFLDLLPLSKDTVALEIGVGFGQHTPVIASRVRWLDALEVRLVNAIFAKTRCEQEHALNVTFVCGGDDCCLPFPDASYDVVLLNLVLEWCAGGNQDAPSIAGQRRLLCEIHRVLKPQGYLQLNTKNRFAYRLLLGGRDEHAHGLPFGSALPRPLLKLILWLTGKGPCPGHLHSYSALGRLLLGIGFSPIESYWTVPEMRFPEHFVPTNTAAVREAKKTLIRQSNTRLTDLLMRVTPASKIKHLAPGLFFVARKA